MQTFTHYVHKWANSTPPRNLIFKNIWPSSHLKFVHDKNHVLLYLDKSATVVISGMLINTILLEMTLQIQNWNTAIKRYWNKSSNIWTSVNSTWLFTITSEPAILSVSRKWTFQWQSHGAQYNLNIQLLLSQLQHPTHKTLTDVQPPALKMHFTCASRLGLFQVRKRQVYGAQLTHFPLITSLHLQLRVTKHQQWQNSCRRKLRIAHPNAFHFLFVLPAMFNSILLTE